VDTCATIVTPANVVYNTTLNQKISENMGSGLNSTEAAKAAAPVALQAAVLAKCSSTTTGRTLDLGKAALLQGDGSAGQCCVDTCATIVTPANVVYNTTFDASTSAGGDTAQAQALASVAASNALCQTGTSGRTLDLGKAALLQGDGSAGQCCVPLCGVLKTATEPGLVNLTTGIGACMNLSIVCKARKAGTKAKPGEWDVSQDLYEAELGLCNTEIMAPALFGGYNLGHCAEEWDMACPWGGSFDPDFCKATLGAAGSACQTSSDCFTEAALAARGTDGKWTGVYTTCNPGLQMLMGEKFISPGAGICAGCFPPASTPTPAGDKVSAGTSPVAAASVLCLAGATLAVRKLI
jgi:hypothetical protein